MMRAMSEKRSWGDTVLGWFVERDDEKKPAPRPEPEAEEPRHAAPRPAAPKPAPPMVELKGEVPTPPEPGAPFDFSSVYKAAGIMPEAQDRVEKAIALLSTLPADASKEVKRQIVEASLKAFGYPVEQIIQAAATEVQALHAFIGFGERSTTQAVAEAHLRIDELEKQIAEARALIEQKQASQEQLAGRCNQQKLRVQEVLEFFGQETVARVVVGPPAENPPVDKPE
jgi:hypothetical protein